MSERASITVPFLIRNLKPRKWPTWAMRLCILASLVSCFAVVALAMMRVPYVFSLLMAIPMLVGFAGAAGIAIFSLLNRPIDKLLLGDVLETWPGRRRFAISNVQFVEFVTGLEDDYADLDGPHRPRACRIRVRSRAALRDLLVFLGRTDAVRLQEWAAKNEIRVHGFDRRCT